MAEREACLLYDSTTQSILMIECFYELKEIKLLIDMFWCFVF